MDFKGWLEQIGAMLAKPMDKGAQMRSAGAEQMLTQQMSKDPKTAEAITRTASTNNNPAQKAQLIGTASKILQSAAQMPGNPEGKPKIPDMLSAIQNIQKSIAPQKPGQPGQ